MFSFAQFSRTGLVVSVVLLSRAVAYFTASAIEPMRVENLVGHAQGSHPDDGLLQVQVTNHTSIDETLLDAFGEAAYAICAFAVVAFLGAMTRNSAPSRAEASTASTRAVNNVKVVRLAGCEGEASPDWRLAKNVVNGGPESRTLRSKQADAGQESRVTKMKNIPGSEVRPCRVRGDAATGEPPILQQLVSALRAYAAKHCFREALQTYSAVADIVGAGNGTVWSLLLYCAVEAQQFRRCKEFYSRLCAFQAPSNHDFVNMVRYYAYNEDLEGFTSLLKDCCSMDASSVDVIARNRALAVCLGQNALEFAECLVKNLPHLPMDVVGYNTLMKGYVQARQYSGCFELYSHMREEGVECSEMTFGIVLDASLAVSDYTMVKRVFSDLKESGKELNVVHYTTFIKGLVSVGAFDDAMEVLEEMCGMNIEPDLVTYTTLLKAHSDAGDVVGALRVHQLMLTQGIVPDVIVYHVLLTGCSVKAMNPQQVLQVFDWIVELGFQPSTTTLSILVKVFAKSRSFSAMLDLLETTPTRFQLWPAPRIYAQLAHACVGAKCKQDAVEAYAAMVRSSIKRGMPVEMSTNNRLSRLCFTAGEGSVASQIYTAVVKSGGRPTVVRSISIK